MLDEGSIDFTIYRPPKPTGKLDGIYYTTENINVWKPSLSYKHNIDDVKNQFTPAEKYRHSLATSGKFIRTIQRLEIRWNKNLDNFIKAAIKIQSLYRGNVSRIYFDQIKEQLLRDLHQREAHSLARNLFIQQKYEEVINEVRKHFPTTIILQEIKMKSEYRQKLYLDCIKTSNYILQLDSFNETGYYIQACTSIILNDYEKAYKILKQLVIAIESPQRDSYRLCACVAGKIQPPNWLEVADSLNPILKWNKHDFEVLFERAGAFCCLQEWELAQKDLDLIIAFNPHNFNAILKRARLYACIRQWDNARIDYHTILALDPSNELALKGLKDIEDMNIVAPMLDESIIENLHNY